MTIIGFDVSKNELIGTRINKRALPLELYSLPNEREALRAFLEKASKQHPRLLVASEATAEYHRILSEEAVRLSIPFRLINPILTKQFTRATIRKQKTDQSDALIIAKLALQGEGSLMTSEALNPVITINRVAHKLVRLRSMASAINQRLERVFPEEIMVRDILNAPISALTEAVTMLRNDIAKRTDPRLLSLLESIPGVGPTLAMTLINEIGSIQRFSSVKALIAYAGLDPRVRQSGISLRRNTKITKRGSPYLRRAAYIAAYIAARHDSELRIYFEKKILEGKRYKEATVAVARKILARVYAVWKRGTPYQKHSLSTGAY